MGTTVSCCEFKEAKADNFKTEVNLQRQPIKQASLQESEVYESFIKSNNRNLFMKEKLQLTLESKTLTKQSGNITSETQTSPSEIENRLYCVQR